MWSDKVRIISRSVVLLLEKYPLSYLHCMSARRQHNQNNTDFLYDFNKIIKIKCRIHIHH